MLDWTLLLVLDVSIPEKENNDDYSWSLSSFLARPLIKTMGTVMAKEILKILIVEDDRKREELFRSWMPDDFRAIFAKTAGTALGMLERDRGYIYAGVCLDHDLQQRAVIASDHNLSGTTVVRAVTKYISPDIPVLIHSRNLKRARFMANKLFDAGFDVVRIPMDELGCEMFQEWLEEVKETWKDLHE